MSRSSTLIVAGLLIIFFSFMGFPLAWLHVMLPILGLIVVGIGFLIRADHVRSARQETPPPPAPPFDGISSIA